MENTNISGTPAVIKNKTEKIKKNRDFKAFLNKLVKQRTLIFMSIPFVAWLIIFAYMPLWGWTMAFQDFKPGRTFFEQPFVGLKHFIALFSDPIFKRALRNTVGMSALGMVFGFIAPIIFALLLNEVRHKTFKRFTQTISYLPHFVSWVIAASIVTNILSNDGIVNAILTSIGFLDKPYQFMAQPKAFWFIVVFADIWKELGWNAIIYLAAIIGIDPQLYEAASVDGAGRWRKMINITMPCIMPTITVLFIMSVGNMINIGFERQRLLGNSLVKEYSLVIEQYAIDYGIKLFRYSYGTAIGIFKSVVSLVLLFTANGFARKTRDTALF